MHGIIVFIVVVVVVVVARLRYSTMTACCIYGVQLHACMHASIYPSIYSMALYCRYVNYIFVFRYLPRYR